MWQCRRCGRLFANQNQPHSCIVVPVEAHLEGKPEHVIRLYRRFAQMVKRCGPVRMAPTKTRIGFQVRMIFAAVTVKQQRLDGHLVLARRFDHPRFARIDSLSPRNHVHHFRIRSLDELDGELQRLVCEAYAVGQQKHLENRPRSSPGS
jgi:Domain of unknown function (DUF5655)